MIVLTIIAVLIAIFILPCVLTNILDYNKYKKNYLKLKELKFEPATYSSFNQVRSKDDEVIWFANTDSFKVFNFYLHNALYTYLDPYTCYWYFKYKRWFYKNCLHLKK